MISARIDTEIHDHRYRHYESTSDNHYKKNRHGNTPSPPERIAIVRWTAGLGAVTAEALAAHLGVTVASARGRLVAAEGDLLLKRRRPLTDRPALYTVTRAGMRAACVAGLDPCRVSASNTLHLIACAHAAAMLSAATPITECRASGSCATRSASAAARWRAPSSA